jgi:hypothetical protein
LSAAHKVRGDRHKPRLPMQPHLRAVRDQEQSVTAECPLYSRIGRRLVPDGFLLATTAYRLLVAGEA